MSDKPKELRLPEMYNACAHPQSVWFEEHWRPIFKNMNEALLAAEAERDLLKQKLEVACEVISGLMKGKK